MRAHEHRTFSLCLRPETRNQDGKIIEGHAAVFNRRADIGGAFYEIIEPSAFDKTILDDVALFVNHDAERIPLARTTSGTLALNVDNVGLAIRARLDVDNNPSAKELYSAVSRGDIQGMSFAFTVADDDWQDSQSDMPTRRIKKIEKVFEISCVTYPAYSDTDVVARSTENILRKRATQMTFEEFAKHMKQYEVQKAAKPPYEIDERTKIVTDPNAIKIGSSADYIQGKGFIPAEERNWQNEKKLVEQRVQLGEALKNDKAVHSIFSARGEMRTMTVTPPTNESQTVVVPTYSSETINPDFNVVSALVDSVAYLSLPGGESFSQPYLKDIASGAYTDEGEDYAEAESAFDFADINRCKITAYAELTEELEKLPAAAYANVVFQNIRTSMRKLLTREILIGTGLSTVGNKHRIVGIFSERATAIDAATDLSLSTITNTTLDEILYNYGGEEDVEHGNCLILNKLDLMEFAKVRTSTQQKFYDINFDGSVGGTINGVRFIVSSACQPLNATTTQTGAYCMAYGNLQNYLLVEFSPLDVRRSDDFKFRQGVTCFRGSVFIGGNVVKKNGFIRIRKS